MRRAFLNGFFMVVMYFFLTVVFIATLYPFWYVFVYSISDPAKFSSGFQVLPNAVSLGAYISIFTSGRVMNAFMVSVARSTTGPFISGVVSLMIAYAVSCGDLPGRKFFNWYFTLTMYFSAGLIPIYLLNKSLGLNNSFWIYIVPSIVNVYGMILIRTYIESLPGELKESAFIDGANDFHIFYKIVTPLCLPVLAAVTLFACVGQWNSLSDTIIYNATNEKLHTLQYVLATMLTSLSGQQMQNASEIARQRDSFVKLTPMVMRMAITVVTIVPIAMVYPFLQRYFVKGLLIGSIKG